MQEYSGKFAALFKKYRLKAEFSTLTQFGSALAEKGYIYEDSIFSHWQKGTRVPHSRILLLKILEIFIQKKAITTIDQANELLNTVHTGSLTDEELTSLPLKLHNPIFQVPNEISDFIGRREIIEKLTKDDIQGRVILIHGPAGIGKTALAIRLGHLLKDRYTEGVLWYKVEEDNLMDILHSIARIFGEDISSINSLQVRTTVVRSILSGKNTLLFLDSAELSDNIHLLIPNSQSCTTIITSQNNIFKTPTPYIDIPLKPFTSGESVSLFKEVLKKGLRGKSRDSMIKLASQVSNLPLAVHILARQLLHEKISIAQLPDLLDKESSFVTNIYREEKSLYTAVSMTYKNLDDKMKSILLSASIFKGKDFSTNSIGYINGLSPTAAIKSLEHLVALSLLEHSTQKRYRIHPAIREFIRDKLDYPRSSYLQLIAVGIFLLFTVWWIFLQTFTNIDNSFHVSFGSSYGLLALYGGICGIHIANKWGKTTLMGKSILSFTYGLILQEIGQLIYSYYIFYLHIPDPYPAWGDLAFYGSIPFYILGIILLAKASGVHISKQSLKNKLQAILIPLTMLLFSYVVFLQSYTFDWSFPQRIIIDLIVPFGQAIYISIAMLTYTLTKNILDGIMKSKALLILFALFTQYVADWTFIYQVSRGTWIANGVNDYMYLFSYFVMTMALLNLKSILVNVKTSNM